MKNLLIQYIDKTFSEKLAETSSHHKPVVTLSREFGCPSRDIGMLLTEEINKITIVKAGLQHHSWRFINKEIVEHAAMELELKPVEMHYVLNSAEKSLFEDILVSFTKVYVSNIRLKHTLQRVIKSLVSQGNVILVGRGSAVILQGFPGALHIRLQASLDWRANVIRKRKRIQTKEAYQLVKEIDQNRLKLIEFLLGKKFDLNMFDAIFNCERLSNEAIVSSILRLMKLKKMI